MDITSGPEESQSDEHRFQKPVPLNTETPRPDRQSSNKPIQPVKIFYCYARRDKALHDRLENHLEPLKRSGLITTWYDREILPGVE